MSFCVGRHDLPSNLRGQHHVSNKRAFSLRSGEGRSVFRPILDRSEQRRPLFDGVGRPPHRSFRRHEQITTGNLGRDRVPGGTERALRPRVAAEAVSTSFLHCILKGLHQSPRIITDRMQFVQPSVITAADISCIVIPDGCVGLPTLAALEQGIPVIAVKENKSRMKNDLKALPFRPGKLFFAENYLEAVGIMASLKAGVSLTSVRRPLNPTKVSTEKQNKDIVNPEKIPVKIKT